MQLMRFSECFKCRFISFLRPYSRYSRTHSVNAYNTLKLQCFKISTKYHISKRYFSIISCLKKNDNNYTDDAKGILLDESYSEAFTNRLYRHPGTCHNILVIQPRNKAKREKIEQSERQLDEAVALVDTLRQWKVVEKLIIPTQSIGSKLVFGSGNFEKIQEIVRRDVRISGIFIGMDIMTALQNASLEKAFGVPVFDRYQIILQIFHNHAHTQEAKLQLALAEIPYLKVKLAMFSHTFNYDDIKGIDYAGGQGETDMEKRKKLLQDREVKLKKALQKVKNQREQLRNTERRTKYPIVAVVGYTNCGKTTLIKALTKDERLLPEDKLFATLDVTLHSGRLPSSQTVLFIDTVGFISNVPTSLIQAFRSTLEEITLADLVIHVRDISNPDAEHQKDTVLKTLDALDLPEKLKNTIIEVRNKADLLESIPEDTDDSEALYISATEGTNLDKLLEVTEEKILENTDNTVSLIRVLSGGEEYRWLMKEAAIRDSIVDNQDQNYMIVEVIISSGMLAKFKHKFGDMTVSLKDIEKYSS